MKERELPASVIEKRATKDTLICSDPDDISQAILRNLRYEQGRTSAHATINEWYTAIAHTVGERLFDCWVETLTTRHNQPRIVSYLSAEFLPGPHLENAIICLGIYDRMKEAVTSLGIDFDRILDHEQEPGLGNGGLGRLAACFLDSMATLKIPASEGHVATHAGCLPSVTRSIHRSHFSIFPAELA